MNKLVERLGQGLTLDELNARTNQLARELRSIGVARIPIRRRNLAINRAGTYAITAKVDFKPSKKSIVIDV